MPSNSPRPAALKLLNGRREGQDSGGRKVSPPPAFRRLPPTPPSWLGETARAEWDRVIPELTRLELTKELDASSLAAYCQMWALFVDCVESVEEHGLMIINTGREGATQHAPNPAVNVMLKASAQLRAWAGEFGLTPSSESRLKTPEVPDAGEANPFE